MQKKCKFVRIDTVKSKSGTPFYLGCFCDEDGQIFKVFVPEDISDYLSDIDLFTDVILDLEISVYKENLSLRVSNVH